MIDESKKSKYLLDREKYVFWVSSGPWTHNTIFDFYIDTKYLDQDIIRVNYIDEDEETDEEFEEIYEIDIQSAYQFELEDECYNENDIQCAFLSFKIREREWEIYFPLHYMKDFERMIDRRNNNSKMFDIIEIEEKIIDMNIDDALDVVVHLGKLPEEQITMADHYIAIEVDEKSRTLFGNDYAQENLGIPYGLKYQNFVERSEMKWLMFSGRDDLREVQIIFRDEYRSFSKEKLRDVLLSYKDKNRENLPFKDWLIIKRIHKLFEDRNELEFIEQDSESEFISMIVSRAYFKVPDRF